MNTIHEKYKILISRYLNGEITLLEKETLMEWIESSPANRQVFEHCKKIWSIESVAPQKVVFDKEAAFSKICARIDTAETKTPVVEFRKKRSRGLYYIAGIAATMLLLFGAYFTFSDQPEPEMVQYAATGQQFETITFPDKSIAYLKPGSSVTIAEEFSGDFREVNLNGEGFFEVTHNPDKPFIVNTGETQVRVLGTSFNVAPCAIENQTRVDVVTGKVQFSGIHNVESHVILTKKMTGIFDHSSGDVTSKTSNNMNFLAWKTGVLEFTDTPLAEVFKSLRNTYGIQIKVETNIHDQKLTARFDQDTPENIFHSLELLYGFKVKKSNKVFIIK